MSRNLATIVAEDQFDRRVCRNPAELARRDERRRAEVHGIIQTKRLLNPTELTDAALVLHHGVDVHDAILAHLLAGAALLAGHEPARALLGPTFDRLLHRLGHPQALGTQWVNGVLCVVRNGRLCSVDPAKGIDVPALTADGPMSEGSVVQFGDEERTREPCMSNLPTVLHAAYARYPL